MYKFVITLGLLWCVSAAAQEHGHLCTVVPDTYGNVKLAIRLPDSWVGKRAPVEYRMDGSLSRVEWSDPATFPWIYLPVPANCRKGDPFGHVERITVNPQFENEDVICFFCVPPIYDDTPPEQVQCGPSRRRAVRMKE